ncbi:MAG: hypothetical protein PIR53_08045 [Nocardioides alkalitolerans]
MSRPIDRVRELAAALGARLPQVTVWHVGLVLVGLQTLLRALTVPGSYFWQDDFRHLELARTLGLSREFLVRDYNGHLEPGQYAVYWLVSHLAETSFLPAAISLVVLQLLASLLLLAVLRALFPPSPWLLVPFAAYLFTPLGLATSLWWAAGLQALPLQVAMLAALLGLVLHVRTGRRRWAVLSVLAQVVGLVFWEKAALVLPLLLAVHVLVLGARLGWRARVAAVLRVRWLWLAHGLVWVAYVAAYLTLTDGDALGAEADDQNRWLAAARVLFQVLLPGVVGAPWSSDGAINTVYAVVPVPLAVVVGAGLLALVVLSLRRRRGAWQAWLVAVGYVAADVLLLVVGRADALGLVARDPRYITDALPVLVVAVCAAFAPVRSAGADEPRPGPPAEPVPQSPGARAPFAWSSPALLVTTVVAASCVLTTLLLVPVVQREYSENYVAGALRALDEDPAAPLLNLSPPQDIAVSTDLEGILTAVGRAQALDRPGTELLALDGLARLRPVGLTAVTDQATGPEPGCGWAVSGPRVHVLDRGPDDGIILRLGVVAGAESSLVVRVGSALGQVVTVPEGVGYVWFVVRDEGSVLVQPGPDAAPVCVTDAALGSPDLTGEPLS